MALLGCFVKKAAFSFKSQGIEQLKFSSKDCQNLKYGSLLIVDPQCIEITSLAVLNIK